MHGKSKRVYGHSEAGEIHAFADPENRIAFAYTMDQMNYGVLPGPKAIDMVDAIYQ